MVFKREGGTFYYYKFFFKGDQVYKSTRQTSKRVAEQMEAAHKTALAKGEVGLLEKKVAPSFSDLRTILLLSSTGLRKRATTGRFYNGMVRSLRRFDALNKLTIDQIDDVVIDRYIEHRRSSTCLMVVRSTNGASEERQSDKPLGIAVINRELATLRRMLNLAKQWRLLDVVPHISLLPGEEHRERVISHAEEDVYLALAPDLLKDFAIVSLNTALRPGEIQRLRWENIHFDPVDDAEYGSIHNSDGGPKKRERNLSMTAKVREVLLARWKAMERPVEGWVFAGDGTHSSIIRRSTPSTIGH